MRGEESSKLCCALSHPLSHSSITFVYSLPPLNLSNIDDRSAKRYFRPAVTYKRSVRNSNR